MALKNGKWKKFNKDDIKFLLSNDEYEDIVSIAHERLKDMYGYNYDSSFNQETKTPSAKQEYNPFVLKYLHLGDDIA